MTGSRPNDPDPSLARTRRRLLWLAALLAVAAAALLAASSLSFAFLEPRIDALAWDGEAEPFTLALHASAVARARGAAALLLVLGAGLAAGRGWLARLLDQGGPRFAAGAREIQRSLRGRLAGEGAAHWAVLGTITAVGLGLRVAYLGHPLRRDEAFSFNNFIDHPFPVALSNYAPLYGNNNHLLNTALAKLSVLLFGVSPEAVRLPVLVAGVLTIPVTYLAARLLHDRRVGLLAGTFVAVSPFLVARSTDARGYSLVLLCAVACLALAAYELRRRNDFGWLLFAAFGALGLYAIPTMLYPLGAIGLWWLGSAWRAGSLRRRGAELVVACGAAGAGAALLYAPVLMVSGLGSITDNHWVQPRSAARLAEAWPELAGRMGALLRDEFVWPLGWGLAGAFVLGLLFHRRLSRQPLSIWPALLLWCAALLAVQRVVPFLRVWSFLLPLYFVTASAGLVFAADRLLTRRPAWAAPGLAAAALAVLVLSAGLLLRGDRIYRDTETGGVYAVDEAAAWIRPHLEPGDRVFGNDTPGLVYELAARGVSLERLRPAPGAERRLLVLATDPEQAVAWLREQRLAPEAFGPPQPLVRFERYVPTTWYRFERRDGLAQVSSGP